MHRLVAIIVLASVSSVAADPDPRYVDAIKKAASGYLKWGKVDDRTHVAPTDCAAPSMPGHVRMSAAEIGSPHGKKLYYLWASDRNRYLNAKAEIPVGFSIIKQSFVAVRATTTIPDVEVVVDGKDRWTTGAAKDLFVMTKVGDKPGSDAGWVYGTVAPDGTVTSAGRVETCMHCHVDQASRERLFGLASR